MRAVQSDVVTKYKAAAEIANSAFMPNVLTRPARMPSRGVSASFDAASKA